MKANPLSPTTLFDQKVRYLIPLFQRGYVWTKDDQWAPMWEDVRALAEKVEKSSGMSVPAHFLGAIVTEGIQEIGLPYQAWSVIDGQQRLTTLQLLLDAARRAVAESGDAQDAALLGGLVDNAFIVDDEKRFKVWPTNRDRAAFEAAMRDEQPIPFELRSSRIVQAHDFFRASITAWAAGSQDVGARLHALSTALRSCLSVVAIQLYPGDDAQVIFETLNFRGAPLLSADLVKNLLFKEAEKHGIDTEKLYEKHWQDLDGDFWQQTVRQGRLSRPRIDLFLAHWLVMKLGKEIGAEQVFAEFRDAFGDARPDVMMRELHAHATAYAGFMTATQGDPHEGFRYRVVEVLDSSVMMPVVLRLLTANLPEAQRSKAFDVLESWLVRRALARLGTKDINHLVIDLVQMLDGDDVDRAGDLLEQTLLAQGAASRHWPDDDHLRDQLAQVRAYKAYRQPFVRLLLESVELSLRDDDFAETTGLKRGLSIEHVMPQGWRKNWPLDAEDPEQADERDWLVQTLGNLTLVTGKHNSSLSNRPWLAPDGQGKRDYLAQHATALMNKGVLSHDREWTEADIRERTGWMTEALLRTWPRPAGGAASKDVLRDNVPTAKPATETAKVYDLAGPGWDEKGVPRWRAVPALVQRVHDAGVSMVEIDAVLGAGCLRSVDGTLDGDDLDEALATAGVGEGSFAKWTGDEPIHDGGRTWVVRRHWGREGSRAIRRLALMVDDVTVTVRERPRGFWTLDDLRDAVMDEPELSGVVDELVAATEGIGGRCEGTAAAQPSVRFGGFGVNGDVWPMTVYAGLPRNSLRVGFGYKGAAEGADEEFLTALGEALPTFPVDEVRGSGFKKWPAASLDDLLRPGVPTMLAEAMAVYQAGESDRWWGIHNNALGIDELVAGDFISVGWDELGDLRGQTADKDRFKKALREHYPAAADGAIANWAGQLTRFADDMRPGDHVVATDRTTRTLGIARITGDYFFDDSAPVHRHRRPVEWLATGIERSGFSQDALNEIGSALTLFRVRKAVPELMGVRD